MLTRLLSLCTAACISQYYRRAAALQMQLDGPFDDFFGPLMLILAITLSLLVSVVLYFAWGGQ